MRLAGTPSASRRLKLRWFSEPPPDPGRRVVATGVFDLLHVGHVRFLEQARAAGTSLVVGVEADGRVTARKGGARPIVPTGQRCELLRALQTVEGVFVVDGPPGLWTPAAYADVLRAVSPRALALTEGDPAEPGKREAARRLGAEVVVVPRVEGWSTTGLLEACTDPERSGDHRTTAA